MLCLQAGYCFYFFSCHSKRPIFECLICLLIKYLFINNPFNPKQVHLNLDFVNKLLYSPRSFKDKYRASSELPPAEMEGLVERKQELQSGGKKATIRSWKHYYTVLCGQLLCFFKDRQGQWIKVQTDKTQIGFSSILHCTGTIINSYP